MFPFYRVGGCHRSPFACTKNGFLSAMSSNISHTIFIQVLHKYSKKIVFKRLPSCFWACTDQDGCHPCQYINLQLIISQDCISWGNKLCYEVEISSVQTCSWQLSFECSGVFGFMARLSVLITQSSLQHSITCIYNMIV